MMNKLINELKTIGISLSANTLNPEFSNYVITFDDTIVGYGWNSDNVNEKVGFMGWAAPAWENCAYSGGNCATYSGDTVPLIPGI